MTIKCSTAADLCYIVGRDFGPDAKYVANLVLARGVRPVRRLRTLLALLRAGHAVRCALFSADYLVGVGTGALCGFGVLDAAPAHAVEAAHAARVADGGAQPGTSERLRG
jgi:hypothetical protein